jgi:hypothetical protein
MSDSAGVPLGSQGQTERVLQAVEEIPAAKKAAYVKAQERCPQLLKTESDPLKFLRYDKDNYWKAAVRLVLYWEEREGLFGEKAFLPMTQTGNGALSVEDVMALHTGNYALLPKASSGEEVVFVDRSRVLPTSTLESKVRALFYMLSYLTNGEHAQTIGCRALVLLITPRTTKLDLAFVRRGIHIANMMPVKVRMHLLMCQPKSGMTPFVQSVMTFGLSHASTNIDGLEVHSKPIGDPILNLLRPLGLDPAGLPSSIGGTWKYESYTWWCRSRSTEEHGMDKVCNAAKPRANNTSENKRKRTQSLNVIHSRLKRERRKTEQQALQEAHNRLVGENGQLLHERSRLEILLTQAREAVRAGETGRFPSSAQTNLGSGALFSGRHGPADSGSFPTSRRDAMSSVVPTMGTAAQIHSQSLSSSLNVVLNQPPEFQRLLLAALEEKTHLQQLAQAPALPERNPYLHDPALRLQAGSIEAFQVSSFPDTSRAAREREAATLELLTLLAQSQRR